MLTRVTMLMLGMMLLGCGGTPGDGRWPAPGTDGVPQSFAPAGEPGPLDMTFAQERWVAYGSCADWTGVTRVTERSPGALLIASKNCFLESLPVPVGDATAITLRFASMLPVGSGLDIDNKETGEYHARARVRFFDSSGQLLTHTTHAIGPRHEGAWEAVVTTTPVPQELRPTYYTLVVSGSTAGTTVQGVYLELSDADYN